jgi:CheY-like chemotaxis protein
MPRVLIVEDDGTLLEVLRAAFIHGGWQVATATSSDQALRVWVEWRPDVVLTDKNLPSGTSREAKPIVHEQAGVALVREIRRHDHEVGIVLMTAYGTAESARDTLNLGIDQYLEKPFHDLFAVVERLKRLAERASSRAPAAPGGLPSGGLTIVIAAKGERQKRIRSVVSGADRLLFIDDPEAIRPSAKSEHADVVILDGGSFPEEITVLVVAVKTRVRAASCVVLSEGLPLSDIQRLIDLNVKALVDLPLASDRFDAELRSVLERLHKL